MKEKLALGLIVIGIVTTGAGAIPENDNFATRISLFGTNVTTTGSNVGATFEPGEPNDSLLGGKSVWWTWTAPADGGLTVSTAGSSYDTILSVFTGDTLTNLFLVEFNDTETNTSLVTCNVTAGTPYQIAVDGALNATGQITLQLTLGPTQPPPSNDNFSNRIVLTGTHLSNVTGSNLGATKESGEPFHADQVGGRSVWWTWTAPSSGGLTLTTQNSAIDTLLAVYTGDSLSNLTFVAGNDEDPTSQFGLTSLVTCNVIGGTTYQLAVDGYDGDSGAIRLRLDLGSAFTPPPNDYFSDRIVLTGSSITTTGSNVGASFEAIGADFQQGEPEHLDTFGGKSVWWTWTAPSSGWVTLTTSNSVVDTVVVVYTGTDFTNLAFVAGNDEDLLSSVPGPSRVTFNALKGTNYQIVVDGYDSDSGAINLQLRMSSSVSVPANNNFANRILLTGTNVSTTGSSIGATFERGEPLHNYVYGGKSVWWRWVSPGPGMVTIDTIGSDFGTLLAVYKGTALSNLVEIASDSLSGGNYTSLVTFYTKGGVTNQIAVDGYDGDSGHINLHIAFIPASYSLTAVTNPAGAGTISIVPAPDLNGKYAPDSVVTLTAAPANGSQFTGWSGSLSGINNPVSIGMTSNKTITANFLPPPPVLKAYWPQNAQSIQSNGFRLLLSGPTNFSYAAERTTNLLTWTAFQTNLVLSNNYPFRDPTASNSPTRFYRARRLP